MAGYKKADGTCIKRNWAISQGTSPGTLGAIVTAAADFSEMQKAAEGPHGSIHNMLGGTDG
jgi:hypothetical protein